MLDPAATTPPLERWSERLSEQVSTGQLQWPTPRNWSNIAKDASSSPSGLMYLLMKSRRLRRPGHLHVGVLT